VHPVALDVRDYDSIQTAVADAIRHFGRIDILLNNAGCNRRKPAVEVTWDDWNTVLDTNLRGTFFVAQAVARHMIPRQYGRIINIGSVTSVAGFAGLAPYGASRGGVKQLTDLAGIGGRPLHHRTNDPRGRRFLGARHAGAAAEPVTVAARHHTRVKIVRT
jgi:NAD(P)-dependent dehydrogenase (short-subunit alcohol dehydrogenase family)